MFAMISYQDMIVVMIIALLLFGPQKLPEIGRQVGNLLREFRNMTGDVHRALDLENQNHHGYDSGYNQGYAHRNGSTYDYKNDTAYEDELVEETKAIEPFSYSAPASGAPIAATATAADTTAIPPAPAESAHETSVPHESAETSGARVYNEPIAVEPEKLAVSSVER